MVTACIKIAQDQFPFTSWTPGKREKKLQSLLKNFFKKIKPQEPDLVAPQQEYVDVYSEREFAGYTAFYCYNTFSCKTFQTL